jgi:integrase/recombinase XerD
MTPLRRRFVEDLTIRNYSPRTIECYVAFVARFAAHFGRSPEQLGAEEVRAFQLHLLEKRVSWSQFNQAVCALRLFYRLTLRQPDLVTMIPYGKKPKTIPCVLSADEVARLLRAAPAGRDRMLLQTAYALGLRLEELVHLQVGDIDGERRVVHVRLGKGAKDRLVPISDRLLTELRAWWRVQRPPLWLFPGGKPNARLTGEPITDGGVQRIFRRTRAAAGINKPASMHTLRHYADFRIMPTSFLAGSFPAVFRFPLELHPSCGCGIIRSPLLVVFHQPKEGINAWNIFCGASSQRRVRGSPGFVYRHCH